MPAPRPLSPLNLNIQIPLHFRCPISLELMKDPVILCTGQTYDRSSIEKWVASGNTTCPVTMQKLDDFITFIPNHTLRRLIQEWCVANRSRGVERIPTPKQPADLNTIRAFMAELAPAFGGGDDENEVGRRISALRSLRNLAKEGEKNRALMVEAGVVPAVLAAVFDDIKEDDDDEEEEEDDEEETGEMNTSEEEGTEEDSDSEETETETETETEGSCSSDGDGDLESILYKLDLEKIDKKKKKKKTKMKRKKGGDRSAKKAPLICGSVAEEALATIVTLPIRDTERCDAAKPRRLRFLSEVLRRGRSMETRVNAASLIEMMSDSREHQEMRVKLAMTEGVMEGLVELLQKGGRDSRSDPGDNNTTAVAMVMMTTKTKTKKKKKSSSPSSSSSSSSSSSLSSSSRCVKVAIKALFSLCLRRQGKERAVEAGAPAALIERLPETVADRGDAERALGAIELLCTTEGGVMAVAGHAMSVQVLVRLILKVSGRATEFATGSLLAICSFSERLQREAVRAGIVKELLLLMQSDCTHRAKTKAMNLLKLLRGSYDQSVMPEYGRTDVVPF